MSSNPTPEELRASAPVRHSRNRELDFLRGVAILLTFMAHVQALPHPDSLYATFHKTWSLGVDIFFVLSGFLITRSLSQAMTVHSNRTVLRQFWIKRIYRIMPVSMFWLGVAMLAVWTLLPSPPDGVAAILRSGAAAALNLMNFYYSYCSNAHELNQYCGGMLTLGVWWSLSLEEQFYLVFPLLLLAVRKRFAAGVVFTVLCFYAVQHRSTWDWVQATKMDGITLGVLLGLGFDRLSAVSFAEAPRYVKIFTGIGSLALTWVVANMIFLDHAHPRTIYAATAICCLLVVFLASRNDGIFDFGMVSRLVERLGAISFSFYLCHEVLIAFSIKLYVHFNSKPALLPFVGFGTLAFILAVATAKISFALIEKPSMEKGHAKARQAARAAA